jgi:hypothetical protein
LDREDHTDNSKRTSKRDATVYAEAAAGDSAIMNIVKEMRDGLFSRRSEVQNLQKAKSATKEKEEVLHVS